jgi:hypothetical protein
MYFLNRYARRTTCQLIIEHILYYNGGKWWLISSVSYLGKAVGFYRYKCALLFDGDIT